MNLPFGLPAKRETGNRKKDESSEMATFYEHKLAEYRETLEKYKNCMFEYASRLEAYDKRSMDNQLSIVQTAIDMTYLKEQGDKIVALIDEVKSQSTDNTLSSDMERLATSVVDVNYKLDGLDKDVVNRLSEFLLELQKQAVYQNMQLQSEVSTDVSRLKESVKRGQTLLWLMLIIGIFNLSAIVFIGFYIMEIIPF